MLHFFLVGQSKPRHPKSIGSPSTSMQTVQTMRPSNCSMINTSRSMILTKAPFLYCKVYSTYVKERWLTVGTRSDCRGNNNTGHNVQSYIVRWTKIVRLQHKTNPQDTNNSRTVPQRTDDKRHWMFRRYILRYKLN